MKLFSLKTVFNWTDTSEVISTPLTFVTTNHSIYWSNSHNAQHRRQTERRTWRIGQSQACVYGDLCAKGTFDDKIRNALIKNQSIAENILKNIASWK